MTSAIEINAPNRSLLPTPQELHVRRRAQHPSSAFGTFCSEVWVGGETKQSCTAQGAVRKGGSVGRGRGPGERLGFQQLAVHLVTKLGELTHEMP